MVIRGAMRITVEQIRAARALKGWGQTELAQRARLTQVTIANIEAGKSRGSRESLVAIISAFQNSGVEFLDAGVRLSSNFLTTLDGKDSAITLMSDVYFTLRDLKDNKEILFFGSDERRASPAFLSEVKKLRKEGVSFRSLVAEGDSYLRGPLEEYRELPHELLSTDAVVIYGDKVAFFLEVKPSYQILLLRNSIVSNDHRRLFNYFWKSGKQPLISTCKERF